MQEIFLQLIEQKTFFPAPSFYSTGLKKKLYSEVTTILMAVSWFGKKQHLLRLIYVKRFSAWHFFQSAEKSEKYPRQNF